MTPFLNYDKTPNMNTEIADKSGLFGKPASKPKNERKQPAKPRSRQGPAPDTAEPLTNGLDLTSEQSVFAAIKAVSKADSPVKFALARQISTTHNRCLHDSKKETATAHTREVTAKPLTIPELMELLTEAIRSPDATPTDVNKSLQTLRELNPAMFASIDKAPPDPCAIAEFLCSWAGRTGEEIIQMNGGREALERELSKTLKSTVVIT